MSLCADVCTCPALVSVPRQAFFYGIYSVHNHHQPLASKPTNVSARQHKTRSCSHSGAASYSFRLGLRRFVVDLLIVDVAWVCCGIYVMYLLGGRVELALCLTLLLGGEAAGEDFFVGCGNRVILGEVGVLCVGVCCVLVFCFCL